jgi:hypothetical protein
MRRRTIVVGSLVVVAVGGFVLLDADREGREELWNRVTTAFGGEPEPEAVPNWGDVAERIGQFTDEERALREVLTPAGPGEVPQLETPAPATPPAVEAPAVGGAPVAPAGAVKP